MSILNTVDTLIESKVLTDENETKIYNEALKYISKVIELCLIALLFNDYSNLDTKFYTEMRENNCNMFSDLVTSIMVNYNVELALTIYKLFKNDVVKNKGTNVHKKLYQTKIFDPLISDELHKFYIKWKLNDMHADIENGTCYYQK